MKKLFTLAAAVLASFSLWAADPTLPADATPTESLDALTKDATVRCIFEAVHNNKQYFVYSLDTARTEMKAGNVKWVAGPKTDGGNTISSISFASDDAEVNFGFSDKGTKAWGINSSRYAGIRVINCSEFAALTKSNGTKDNKTLYMQVFKKNGAAWDFVESLGEGIYNNSKYYVLSATLNPAEEYVILLTSGNTSNNLTAQIRLASGTLCTDPEASFIADASGFVGEAIALTFSSKNSSAIAWEIKKDGDVTTDAAIAAGKFTASAVGEYVVTVSQDADGTFCEVKESVTLTISAKNPVTSFVVDGPKTAHVGEEVTLTAKDFDAAPTEISWLDIVTGDPIHTGASYTITSESAGDYWYYVIARNEFNDPDPEDPYYAAGIMNYVNFYVGFDATLSDLKVNGATIADFDKDKLEYTISELGVYEALSVEATAADAPFATVAVVDDKAGKVTVTVTAQNKSTQEYVINYSRAAATELVAVSDSLTWDWAKAGAKTSELTNETLPSKNDEFNFADVLSGQDASFKAESLVGRVQYANGGGYGQVFMLKFKAAKAGSIVVEFSNTGTSERPDRVLLVNDLETEYKSKTSASNVTTGKISVAAGDVVIEALEMKETPAKNLIRVYKLTYVPNGSSTAIDNADETVKAVKVIRNGQLFIEKNGVLFNAQGAVVK